MYQLFLQRKPIDRYNFPKLQVVFFLYCYLESHFRIEKKEKKKERAFDGALAFLMCPWKVIMIFILLRAP